MTNVQQLECSVVKYIKLVRGGSVSRKLTVGLETSIGVGVGTPFSFAGQMVPN